jgi:hypothetical protein
MASPTTAVTRRRSPSMVLPTTHTEPLRRNTRAMEDLNTKATVDPISTAEARTDTR